MSIVLKKIIPLRTGTTVVMISRFNNMVRTGTIDSQSTILHCILTSYSKKYRESDDKAKEQYVHTLRTKMANEFNITKWLYDIDHKWTIIPLQKKIREIFIKIYRYQCGKINDAKLDADVLNLFSSIIVPNKDYFDSIFTIMPLKILDKGALHKIFMEFNDELNSRDTPVDKKVRIDKILGYKKHFHDSLCQEFKQTLDSLPNIANLKGAVYNNMQQYFSDFITKVLDCAETSVFTAFKNEFVDTSKPIHNYLYDYFGDYFKRNIFYIDSNDREATQLSNTKCTTKHSKSLILLYMEQSGNHFESIGTIDHKHKVTREFKTSSDLIQNIIEYIREGPSRADLFDSYVSHPDTPGDTPTEPPPPATPTPPTPPTPTPPTPPTAQSPQSPQSPTEPPPPQSPTEPPPAPAVIKKSPRAKKRSRKVSKSVDSDESENSSESECLYQSEESENEYTDSEEES